MVERLFTFLAEREGGTYVSQHNSHDVSSAWESFLHSQGLSQPNEDQEPTPISEMSGVWCQSLVNERNVFWLVHIVETNRNCATGES